MSTVNNDFDFIAIQTIRHHHRIIFKPKKKFSRKKTNTQNQKICCCSLTKKRSEENGVKKTEIKFAMNQIVEHKFRREAHK